MPSTGVRRSTSRITQPDPNLVVNYAGEQAEQLTHLENVAFVTVGKKRKKGVRTSRTALIAYVAKKGNIAASERIPSVVAFSPPEAPPVVIPTDVVELPSYPQVLGMRAGHLIRAADGDFGVCGFSFSRGDRSYVITNAHVVANMLRRTFPGEPSVQNPRTMLYQQIGETIYASNFPRNAATDEDLAIIVANRIAVDNMAVTGERYPVRSVSNFSATRARHYWYMVNGVRMVCNSPEPVIRAAPMRVDNGMFPYVGFWNLRMVRGSSAPGHSGSLICTGTGRNIVACGLLFGGAPPNYVFAFPIDDVMMRVARELQERGL